MANGRNPQTVTLFDESANEDQAVNQVSVLNNSIPLQLLVECLLEILCQLQEKDPMKRNLIYNALCQKLISLKLLNYIYPTKQLEWLKGHVCKIILELFEEKRNSLSFIKNGNMKNFNNTLELVPSSSRSPLLSTTNLSLSRYENEFQEIGKVAEGGFGVVCKARSRLDGHEYAIKKITFKNCRLSEKVQREVKLFAKLSHHNVVCYKNSWIETHLVFDLPCSEHTSNENVLDVESTSGSSNGCSEDSSITFPSDTFFQEKLGYNKEEHVEQVVQHHMSGGVHQTKAIQKYTSLTVKSDFKPTVLSSSPVKLKAVTEKSESSCTSHQSRSINENCMTDNSSEGLSEACDTDAEDSQLCRKHIQRIKSKSYSGFEKVVMNDCLNPVSKRLSTLELQHYELKNDFLNILKTLKLQSIMYIQMELCGESLKDWLNKRNEFEPRTGSEVFQKVDEDTVLKIFQQILKGIAYIHSKGLIHRDLKPQNILFEIGNNSRVKIGDFGLATMASADHDSFDHHFQGDFDNYSSHTKGVGTSLYSAPEQQKGSGYNFKADMFSSGAIFLELLHPFGTEMERIRCLKALQTEMLPKVVEEKWPELTQVLKRLILTNPSERPTAVEALNSMCINKNETITKVDDKHID
ncbi:eukaryotic translation initiation factor 2-alpha kinase 1-like isoform X2 [Limulus polyphemus]|uniref:Eukaryotic translation initiation factor 2-alpha kinase 1 n=1 Tax=Limulus polyphemus TaxID=6850 RepID=A0ABM1SBD3_LIMPO|nr:eukaryotic translation initiation factor 2-alpha kinase 1-like isoform X2 [Limulus polyphemus]